jgi:hypothetical protein
MCLSQPDLPQQLAAALQVYQPQLLMYALKR